MVPNLSLSQSASATSGGGAIDTRFGNKTDVITSGNYMEKGKPAIVGGGTGISINTPINFSGNLDNTNKQNKENAAQFSDPMGINTHILIFSGLALIGIIFALRS